MSDPAANNEMWACQHCADTYASMPDRNTCFECGEVLIARIPASSLEALKEERDGLQRHLDLMRKAEITFAKACADLPEIPPKLVLVFLRRAGMRPKGMWEIGKKLQLKHGLEAIPAHYESEAAAGLWSVIRAALAQGGES